MDEKLAKVIDLHTKKEITAPPYEKENALRIMEYLMDYANPRTGGHSPMDYKILDQLINMVENNSGVFREEVFKQEA